MLERDLAAKADSVAHLLAADHRRLDSILADAKRRLAAGDLPRARARFAEFRDGLEQHIAAEEEILFPVFDGLPGAAGEGPTRVMRSEHAEIRRLLAEVAASLVRGGDERHSTPLAALTARIYAHNGKEERVLYPAADRVACGTPLLKELMGRLQAS